MRTHGWAGRPPADDDEAVERILAVTRRCIERDGGDIGIVDVARELGVTRQTVYRYFRSTRDLITATALVETAPFLDRLDAHLRRRRGAPAELVVEAIAYTLERLPDEPYMGLLLHPAHGGTLTRNVTSDAARALGRSMIERMPVDWAAAGFDDAALEELVEYTLRITQSFILYPGDPPRAGKDLRAFLRRWLGPALDAHAASVTG